MAVYIADPYGHVERLVSVVKLPTVLEECNTEELSSAVRSSFCGKK
jgi:hypothetical protein